MKRGIDNKIVIQSCSERESYGYLKHKNYLSEFYTEQEKAQARANIGALGEESDTSRYIRSDGSVSFILPQIGVQGISSNHLVINSQLTTVQNTLEQAITDIRDNGSTKYMAHAVIVDNYDMLIYSNFEFLTTDLQSRMFYSENATGSPVANTEFIGLCFNRFGEQMVMFAMSLRTSPVMYMRSFVEGAWQPWVTVGSGSGDSVSWGNITGIIENQTDLVNYVAEHSGGGGITPYAIGNLNMLSNTSTPAEIQQILGLPSAIVAAIGAHKPIMSNLSDSGISQTLQIILSATAPAPYSLISLYYLYGDATIYQFVAGYDSTTDTWVMCQTNGIPLPLNDVTQSFSTNITVPFAAELVKIGETKQYVSITAENNTGTPLIITAPIDLGSMYECSNNSTADRKPKILNGFDTTGAIGNYECVITKGTDTIQTTLTFDPEIVDVNITYWVEV